MIKRKKIDYRPILGFLAIALIISIGTVVLAQVGSQIVNNYYGQTNVDQTTTSEPAFSSFIASPSGFTDVKVTNDLFIDAGLSLGTLDDNDLLTDGYTKKLVTLTITNTSSAGIVNPESETIYVYDASFRYQVATTSIVRLIMGTSTKAFIVPTESAVDFTGSGGDQSILDSGASQFVANAGLGVATTTIFKADFQGVDTRDSSNTQFVVPVLSGEFLTCYASTTPASDTTHLAMGTFQGQCQFKYFIIED